MRPDVDPAVADLLRRCLNREPNHRPSAADAARILSGEQGTGSRGVVAAGSGSVEEVADLQQLIRRRVPQIVLLTGGVALGLIGFVASLIDGEILPPIAMRLTLPFAACGVAASTVVAWFHGEKGSQEASVLEWMLLSVIAVVWIALTAWIVMEP